ncbi:MAG: polyprenyl synthetase family protein [Chloroflexi bacterium]|jgi:geranylgeranyl pyrophosphate synthase|nr:polyprenyl synthetase family protein [Chloroflexota bacterium]
MAIDTLLQSVDKLLLSVTDSSLPLLRETSRHILAAGGKRIRPRLVLLAHAACAGQHEDDAVALAAAIEVIHTATLVHDDINDDGTLRRGRETVNSRWGGTYALLTGDFMFTKAYQIMAPFSAELNHILAQAALDLVEGETLQIQASREGSFDRDTYMQIIAKKTAALFVAAVELGAHAAHAPQNWIEALHDYAFNLGLAFQIVDDVLDLVADPQQIGKNAGIDLRQGRGVGAALTANNNTGLPPVPAQIAAVNLVGEEAAGLIKESLLQEDDLAEVVRKAREKANELASLAMSSLEVLPPSPARDELYALAHLVVERNR